jgi:hypothetical protein
MGVSFQVLFLLHIPRLQTATALLRQIPSFPHLCLTAMALLRRQTALAHHFCLTAMALLIR